jgi:hypothetical protein
MSVNNNTIKILSPMMDTIRKEMEKQISNGAVLAINEVLTDIATTYNLDLGVLKEKYNSKIVFVDNTHVVKQKKPRNIAASEQCMARTSLQGQCTRKRQAAHEYCGSHIMKQPHGRIDDPPKPPAPVDTTIPAAQPKKRGRPKGSTKKQPQQQQQPVPPNDSTTTDLEGDKVYVDELELDGVTYLKNTNNLVFEKTKDNLDDHDYNDMTLLGKYDEVNNTIDFYQNKQYHVVF